MYKLVAVAVNIGQTTSGYTFSTRHQFKNNPLDIKGYAWRNHHGSLSEKVPTSVLLDSNKNFKAFGFEAEKEYLSLLEEGKDEEVYFFQHFLLHAYRGNSNFMAKSLNKEKEVSVDLLFQFSVSYLIDHFLKHYFVGSLFRKDDLFWIFTYPDELFPILSNTIFDACKKAEINQLQLAVLKESTCSVAFCEQFESNCFILDCSVTQLCPRIVDSSTLVSGVLEMSPIVDEFWKTIEEYCVSSLYTGFGFMDRYEIYVRLKTMLLHVGSKDKYRFHIDVSNPYFSELKAKLNSTGSSPVVFRNSKLVINTEIILQIFDKSIKHLEKPFQDGLWAENYNNKETFILVGDFSIYPSIRTVLHDKFPKFTFTAPKNSSLSTLIGGLIFGHQSNKSCIFIPRHPTKDNALNGLEGKVKSAQISSGQGTKREETEDFHEDLSDETSVTEDNSTTAVSLTDPLRPGRISSMFQDLYEVEHADGIKALCKRGVNKDEAMQLMVDILRHSYGACRYQALSQIDHISSTLLPRTDEKEFAATLPPEILQPIMSYRKKNALKYLPEITKTFINELPGKLDISDDLISSCGTFIEKSIECCWLMFVTDPPLFLQFDWDRRLTIDPNLWITEGSSGYYAKTVIWPILYLRENGPVMNKGVALAE